MQDCLGLPADLTDTILLPEGFDRLVPAAHACCTLSRQQLAGGLWLAPKMDAVRDDMMIAVTSALHATNA